MLSLSFDTFLNDDSIECNEYHLYIVKNSEVLYVGIASNIASRWMSGFRSHMMLVRGGWAGISRIGQIVANNIPDSLQWIIELWTLEDCLMFCDNDIKRIGFVRDRVDIKALESMMIKRLRPTVNVIGNTNFHVIYTTD